MEFQQEQREDCNKESKRAPDLPMQLIIRGNGRHSGLHYHHNSADSCRSNQPAKALIYGSYLTQPAPRPWPRRSPIRPAALPGGGPQIYAQ